MKGTTKDKLAPKDILLSGLPILAVPKIGGELDLKMELELAEKELGPWRLL